MIAQGEMAATPKVNAASKATAMLLLAAFFWGSGNLANKTILQDLGPFTVVVMRNLVAAVVLLPMALPDLSAGVSRAWMKSILPLGTMFAVAVIIQQWGYQTATVTNASFLVNTTCVLTPLLALLAFGERLRVSTVVAAVAMLLGALCMSGVLTKWQPINAGDGWCLLSALFYAIWMILLARHCARHGLPVLTTLVQSLFAALIALPFAFTADPATLRNFTGALPEILYLGVFSTAVAFALASAAQRSISAAVGAILMSAESLVGAACGIAVLGERPDLGVILGAALMMAAIVLVSWPDRNPAR